MGPFKILQKVGPAVFKLQLPAGSKIHDVFHVSLLEQYHYPEFETQLAKIKAPSPLIIIDNTLEFEVEQILDSRIHRDKVQYLVHWKGYSDNDHTWKPWTNLTNCVKLVIKFHEENPGKPEAPANFFKKE